MGLTDLKMGVNE